MGDIHWKKHRLQVTEGFSTDFRYTCTVCTQHWLDLGSIPKHCPGMAVYEADARTTNKRPFYLKSRAEMDILDYTPGKNQSPRACLHEHNKEWLIEDHYTALFDVREAVAGENAAIFSESLFNKSEK